MNLGPLHRTLQVPRTAHVYQLGRLSPATTDLWIVCHGYGQLARFFIKNFEVLEDAQTVVLAPEGLSRFYLQGFNGRVGATWMTKEERLYDIADYAFYLNLLREQARQEAPNARLHVLGFSQGAATVCRWLAQSEWQVAQLVLWAGVFPEDMEMASARRALAKTRLTYVYGLEDEFVTPQKLQEQLARVRAAGLKPEIITFDGKHEINPAILSQLKNI